MNGLLSRQLVADMLNNGQKLLGSLKKPNVALNGLETGKVPMRSIKVGRLPGLGLHDMHRRSRAAPENGALATKPAHSNGPPQAFLQQVTETLAVDSIQRRVTSSAGWQPGKG